MDCKYRKQHFKTIITTAFGLWAIYMFLGVYIQRIGHRNNDIEVSNAGRYTFFDVSFGFKYPIYREVEFRKLRNKVLYPQPIKEMLDNNVTFSTTESMSKCQGGDFVLEEKIKKQKGIAPKGIVNSKTWQKISRSIDKVEHVTDNVKKNLGIPNVNLETKYIIRKRNKGMEGRFKAILVYLKFKMRFYSKYLR